MSGPMSALRACAVLALCLWLPGCAHRPLRGAELDRVSRPAFISRIEEGAGPRSRVFAEDRSYEPKLQRLDPREADRRLGVRLQQAMTRFEVAERLRATTTARLPEERPWTQSVDAVTVARALQSFLVEEVPANAPDYGLLSELGADSVVEFVIESYGMRSEGGRAGVFLTGYGRMFTLDGDELWRRRFRADWLDSKQEPLDPLRVAKEPDRFRAALTALLDGVALQFAKDLNPPNRRGAADLKQAPDDARPQRPAPTAPEQTDEVDPFGGGLPDPDA